MSNKHTLLLLTLLLSGCASTTTVPLLDGEPLVPDKIQVWQLVELRGRAVGRQASPTILEINPESGTLHGQTACNSYFANLTMRLDGVTHEGTQYSVKLSNTKSGDTQCPEGEMEAEYRYTATLWKATSMTLTATTLTLSYKGKPLLKYELQ